MNQDLGMNQDEKDSRIDQDNMLIDKYSTPAGCLEN